MVNQITSAKGFLLPLGGVVEGSAYFILPANKTGTVRYKRKNMINSYLNDEDASKVSFKNGYFYPGDLGKLDENGVLYLEGRTNDVINIGGIKLNPENIDQFIELCKSIVATEKFCLSFNHHEAR